MGHTRVHDEIVCNIHHYYKGPSGQGITKLPSEIFISL